MKQGTTLADILRGTNTDIVIPRLQRNYAQGRASAEDIREAFANDIALSLTVGARPLSVDYIYGRSREYEDDNERRVEFVALDGQQRLTTFFLLHWLLAVKEHASDAFLELFSHKDNGISKSRFCYKTRKSANDFCNLLIKIVEKDKNNQIDLGTKPSDYLTNRMEYHLSWKHDSTVQGMLNMLDALNSAAENKFPLGAFERLVSPPLDTEEETRPLFFYLIDERSATHGGRDLVEQKKILTDERQKDTKLFIKMNSRGLPLTAFENFKAELGIFLDEIGLKQYSQTEGTDAPCAHFLWKMDTVWSNFFWRHRIKREGDGNLYDNALMNFMRLYWLTYYAGTEKLDKDAFEYLDKKSQSISDTANSLTFARLRKKGILPAKDDIKGRERLKQAFIVLEKNLDAFCQMGNLDNGISPETRKRCFDLSNYYNTIISNTRQGYAFNILWYAYSKYAASHNTSGIDEWLRVIWNLVEDYRLYYDNYLDFCKAISNIDLLLSNLNGKSILEYLASGDFSVSYGFHASQMAEERIKAWLICHDTPEHEWRKAIMEAEAHPYFKGQIGFLLIYAGLSLDAFPTEDFARSKEFKNALNLFNNYYQKASKVFWCNENDDAVSRLNDNGCCFERAVLCKGNYLSDIGKTINLRSKDIRAGNVKRDHSWKHFLRDDENTRKWVREVLDDSRFDMDNLEAGLNRICDETTVGEYWRNCLIHCPGLFEYGKRGFIFRENDNKIILFGTQQFNQYHVDMFLKYLECRFKRSGVYISLIETKSHSLESLLDFRKDGKRIMTLENRGGNAHLQFTDPEIRRKLFEANYLSSSELLEQNFPIVEAEASLQKILEIIA